MVGSPRDRAFRNDVEPHRRALTLHCYRMLGSLADAEEVAQESLLRGWERIHELRASGSAGAWLHRVATNGCLDRLKKRRRRRTLPHLVGPPVASGRPPGSGTAEERWIEPAPDALLDLPADPRLRPDAQIALRESVGLAFVTALQLLPARQRAALLLADVLGWSPGEVAELLEASEASVSSLLQRARARVAGREREAYPPDDARKRALLRRFISTWESGDMEAFSSLLAEDAVLAMPPQAGWYSGRVAVRAFFESALAAQPREYRLLPAAANGSPAVALYARPPGHGAFRPVGITVLTLRAGLVARMVRFALPRLFSSFGLPAEIQAGEGGGARGRSKRP